jgi:small-conductance mechanosensitive channel
LARTVIDFFSKNHAVLNIAKAAAGLVVLLIVYKAVMRYTKRFVEKRATRATVSLVEKILHYCFLLVAVMYVFKLFGININAVLGAAGIAGVAVGFASQTSVSNIISGFFLLSEKTVKIGDFIDIGGMAGTVDSINLLSVKLKTPDNQMLRVPNETIIKSALTNYSVYQERRFSLKVQVSYDTDLAFALETLKSVPAECGDIILATPEPSVIVGSFDDSGITLTLNAWFLRENLFAAKNALFVTTKKLFDARGISIPFPQLDVHTAREGRS